MVASSMSMTVGLPAAATALALLSGAPPAAAQPKNTDKFHFFCGSSFADIQSDTCASRQWCPSSSDDECLVPGHQCFANTPCDARLIENVQVPTFSLSLHPEYRDPTDKYFCGVDYTDAVNTCEAGGDEAVGRHCPDLNCPPGLVCYIDLPCSYFVLTNPAANPLGNVHEMEVEAWETELPDPGSMESHYFCGPTFQQAAANCNSKSWCRTGTSQECPNGETCFVQVNAQNPNCEINAIVKAEYEASQAVMEATPSAPAIPTERPTNAPLRADDPKNRKFCGSDWYDATNNCILERHCPNGDSDCPGNLKCWDYTTCDAVGLTYMPTAEPTSAPTDSPTPAPIRTSPTQNPTTAKPSRNPTPEPSGTPTPPPTMPPSQKPTYSPLPYGDFRREFWCGISWFDAMENCAKKCPGGQDEECPQDVPGVTFSCLSGVTACKNEMGLGAYIQEEEVASFTLLEEDGGGDDAATETVDSAAKVTTSNPTTNKPSRSPTAKPVETFYSLGGTPNNNDASKPAGGGNRPAVVAESPEEGSSTAVAGQEGDAAAALAATPADVGETPTAEPTRTLQGPYEEEMVRIILYGLGESILSDPSKLDWWKTVTKTYMQNFYNKYPTDSQVINGDPDMDIIRASVYDVTVDIDGIEVEVAPAHDFNPMVVGEIAARDNYDYNGRAVRNLLRTGTAKSVSSGAGAGRANATTNAGGSSLRRRAQQTDMDPAEMLMITYSQSTTYRSSLDVANDDPNFITRHPLETPEYRAEYVSYLRSVDFGTFGDLEYVSKFLYSEFPSPAPTLSPVVGSTDSPTKVQVSDTMHPTENFGCNLCRPGQYGLNANIIFNGEVSTCQITYEWFLRNFRQGSGGCREAQAQLNEVCCRDGLPVALPTQKPVVELEAAPEETQQTEPQQQQTQQQQTQQTQQTETQQTQTQQQTQQTQQTEPQQTETQQQTEQTQQTETQQTQTQQQQQQTEPQQTQVQAQTQAPRPTPPPTRRTPRPTAKETEILEIPVDENGLPDAASLAETYYCGKNWDSIDCETATPCPTGDSGDCKGDDEQCIAFTNCGGKFAFVSDPNVEGGGPDADAVRSTFYCGTSMQFLENKCEGATPCPGGPEDCEGDGKTFGCFAFTGCNEQVDPGSFVGFLRPPDADDVNAPLPAITSDAANTFFCATDWFDLQSKCEGDRPVGATPCPSGDIMECAGGEGCFAFACNNMAGITPTSDAQPAASPSISTGEYSVADMDLLKSTFFCGTSVEQIDGDCDAAIPCPSGDECPPGYGCFAFSQCGGVDIDMLVDSFGNTERPTRAPTVPIEQVCDEERKMSVNVGYWQSWSIYRDEDCQQMNTATFDGEPYSHVVYSFASIDSSYRLEAWNGTYENEVPLYKEFNTVKQRHPGTKTMIAVGGWTHNDPGPMQKRFSQMASSKTNRVTFANSVVQFLRTYGFDGLDLDWEYPGLKERGGKRADYDNYVLMVKEIRQAFNAAPEPFELTVAITGNVTKLEMGFDLAGLAEHIDWFNIMAYDLWGSWDPTQTAYSHTDIRMIDEAVEYMSHFIQRSKLVLGLGSYARTYTLSEKDCLDLGCPFEAPGKSGCEGTDGFLPYFEIADLVTSRQYDYVRFDEESQSMVMLTDGDRLISYDNTVSFNKKIDYAKDMCFMGQMLWAIDMLKDGSNPLSSNNGNSAATGDPSDQSFCGKSYQDVISGCKQPCTSGDSSQCPPGEECFANTGCSIDNIGAPPPTKCRLCPDPSTQGMKDWLEVEFDGETTTCGDADMSVIAEFAKGTSECDSAKQALGDTCCYNYPDNPCMLCRSETEFMDLRAMAEIEFDGESMTCFDLSKRLGPEESDSQMCTAAQKEHWDSCCYNQCTLCEGQGVKWWNEVELEEEPLNCGELDSMLYSDETEAEDEECKDILSEFKSECCYDYPTDPCDVCTVGDKKLTLMPNEEVEYEDSTFTCAEVNNFLSPFESSSEQCSEVRDMASGTCCFDRCSLCGKGARLDPEVLVEVEGEEGSETGTCADIESGLFQEKTTNGSEECTEARTLHYDACCFEIPSEPCQLCATDEYMHHTTTIEFNDEEVTCRSASNFLQERHEMSSNTCSDAKAQLGETCCYSICNICGEYDLDWDVFVNFEGEDMSCGDFNEIFREEAVVDGSEQCLELQSEYFDTCCYTSPTTSCQLCKQGDTFFDLNKNVEVDFNGPTTCGEVANFMSRRIEDTDPVCGVTQTSLFDECCYEKCSLAGTPGTYPDWAAEVEMDGNVATCLELDDAIQEAAIPKDTPECDSLQDAFSPTCSYSIPTNACDICPDNAVSISASAEWNGKEMKCSDIKSRISSREEADGDVCIDAQQSLQGACCIDQCEICDRSQETDFVMTVYHEGKTKQCTEIDIYFYEKSVLASSDECSAAKSAHSNCCYSEPETPCNLCKRDSEYFDLMGSNSVEYMGQRTTCTAVSDMMFRREEEDGDTCSSAKEALFSQCCDTKCSLCPGQGLEAGVKVSFEGRMMTCLEVDLALGPASIEAGSDQCNEIMGQHSEDCCYEKPESPCRICPGDNLGVNKEASVNYLGTETTCESLSNYLGSREEQQGTVCQAATSDHSEDCCFERCSLCGDGKADWETFVNYDQKSIACGDFEWILRGKNVADGSDECNAVKDQFYDTCCYEPPQTSCNLCHIEKEWLDVNSKVEISYQNSPTTCLSLYNAMVVRESSDSETCQAAKDEHGSDCCFEKCKMCQIGFLDTTASVDGMSCSAIDMSFSKDVVVEGSEQCDQKRAQYADACCYTIPDNPCRVCPSGSDINGDATVDFYGENKSCTDIGNKLALSEEAGSDTCSSTQRDFASQCCFERCPICPDGYNLNWEVDVEYNRATIACGEFDNIIRGNAMQKGTQECSSLRSTYSSACCYNYATASGVGYATATTLAEVTTTGYLATNLDTSSLTPAEKEEAKRVFEILIKNTLQGEGVLPPDATVTVTDIDDNGVVQYEITMYIDQALVGSVANAVADTPPPPDRGSFGDISNVAVNEIDQALSNPSRLNAIAQEIQSQATGASDPTVASGLATVSVNDFVLEEADLTVAGDNALVSSEGTLATNIDTTGLSDEQEQEAMDVLEQSIQNTLQAQGIINPGDRVTVDDISDEGDVDFEVTVKISPEDQQALDLVASGVATTIDLLLDNMQTLEAISQEIQSRAPSASDQAVAQGLSTSNVQDSALGRTSLASVADTQGTLATNIDTSGLAPAERDEIIEVIESSIATALRDQGVLSRDDNVVVNDINDRGEVQYQVSVNPDEDAALDLVASGVATTIDLLLNNAQALDAISREIQSKASGSDQAVAQGLASTNVQGSDIGKTTTTPTANTQGTLSTNIDPTRLSPEVKNEIIEVVQSSIANALQAQGVLSREDKVVVNDINDRGEVQYQLTVSPQEQTAMDLVASGVATTIDLLLNNMQTLGEISQEIQSRAPSASDQAVAQGLASTNVQSSAIGETTSTPTANTQGRLSTNINPSTLSTAEKNEVIDVVENSIATALQAQGVLSREDKVVVNDINDRGDVQYEVTINPQEDSGVDLVASGVATAIDQSLSNPQTLEAISREIQTQAPAASDQAVTQGLASANVQGSVLGETTSTPAANTQGRLSTNINPSTLSTAEKDEAIEVVQNSIATALQAQGVLSEDDKVVVNDISDRGEVQYEVAVNPQEQTALDLVASGVATAIDQSLSNPQTLDAISREIQSQAPAASDQVVAQGLASTNVQGSILGETSSSAVANTPGTLATNIDPSSLTYNQMSETKDIVQDSITAALQAVGVISEDDKITVDDISDEGEVSYQMEVAVKPEAGSTFEETSSAVMAQIDQALNAPVVLEAMTQGIQSQAPAASDQAVSDGLASANVQGSSLGKTNLSSAVATPGTLVTNINPSNLNNEQKEEAKEIVADSITVTLQAEGVLSKADKVTVDDIDDQGGVQYQVTVNASPKDSSTMNHISTGLANEIGSNLDAISEEIKAEAAVASAPVAQELSDTNVQGTSIGGTSSSSAVATPGTLMTNINPSNLNNEQKEEAKDIVQESIASTLQAEGVLSKADKVTVNDISDQGEVQYEVTMNVGPRDGSTKDYISTGLANEIGANLEAISDEIKAEAAVASAPVAQELSGTNVQGTSVGGTSVSSAVATPVTLSTNINSSNLTGKQREEVKAIVEESITTALQTLGIFSEDDKVTVNDINDQGEVQYEVTMNMAPKDDSTMDYLSTGLAKEIDSNLGAISDEIKAEAAVASAPVAQELSGTNVQSSSIGQTSASSAVGTPGTLSTNIDTSNLTDEQREEVNKIVADSIVFALEALGLFSEDDEVKVNDINDQGEVQYEVTMNMGPKDDSATDYLSTGLATEIDSNLGAISDEIKAEGAVASAPVAQELSSTEVQGSSIGQTSVSSSAKTPGTLSTNIDTAGLTSEQTEEAKEIVQDSITTTLQAEGVLSEGDKVVVKDINEKGEIDYEVDVKVDPQDDSTLEYISTGLAAEIDEKLNNPTTLGEVSQEIQKESAGSSVPVAQELSDTTVESSVTAAGTVLAPGESQITTTGTLGTNLDTSNLSSEQKEEIVEAVESGIENTLQAEGVLSEGDEVAVIDIDEEGDVEYVVEQKVDSEIDSSLEGVTSAIVNEIDQTLSDPSTLDAISEEVIKESAGTSVSGELSNTEISDLEVGETILTTTGTGDSKEVGVTTSGTLDTNIAVADLTPTQKEEVKEIVENSIEESLQSGGVLPQESTVTVTDINDQGEVSYEIDMNVGPEPEMTTTSQTAPETTTLQSITDAIVAQIDQTLSNPSTLQSISNNLPSESAGSSVSDKLSGVQISDFVQGETSISETSSTATGAGPCNLCKAGEIGLSKQIIFNGAETSCPEVYKFLSTQAEAGSDACEAGKEALHSECCMKKCDLCSGGGIPDWYASVNVNGNSMTCLDLDRIVAESEIEAGTTQCSQLLEVAAPACCYEPPTNPCNMCQNGSEFTDVLSSAVVEYGGTSATCGQIFNTLLSREERDSETCSLIKQDLASQCCFNKCSLCGGLQTNAALSVMHDETQLGCSEFDSYIFASNMIHEGSDECTAFQDEHRDSCCYDVPCSLCAKGNELYTTKEDSVVQYGGNSDVTCGEVANFLYQKEVSQGNACLAAQENIFSDCCFKQCEMCEAGASINWAAVTTFNGQSQSCTDVYWLLISESVEADTQTCRSLTQVSKDCCFQIPSKQCTLCKDDNGATYNTRWNKEVTVNGITKTCGDFNSLLATQEEDSQTCALAKDTIFNDCCFAGSDTLVAIANQVGTESDASCSLCQPGQVGINAEVVFNNEKTSCEEVYNFLAESQKESSTTCKSAQVNLSAECCREPDQLSPGESAFGEGATSAEGEGSVTAEPAGEKVTPPMEFESWTRRPSGANSDAKLAKLCSVIVGVLGAVLIAFG